MNTDFSLIDANIARAREGLRGLDEIARFIFKNEKFFTELKTLRHELVTVEYHFGSARLIAARQGSDVGESSAQETRNKSAWALIMANSNRVTESLRVLEGMALVYAPTIAKRVALSRYTMYRLQRELLFFTPHYYLHKYFEEGIVYPLSDKVEEIKWLVERGAKAVQLRDKNEDRKVIFEKTKQLCKYLAEFNKNTTEKVLLILNDHPDIAAELPVAGVHIGQTDGEIQTVRAMIGSNKIIGRSNHSLEQVYQSIEDGADYVSIGPVYATPTQANREAVGLETVRRVSEAVTIPWLAIGGIDLATIDKVRAAGAKNMAVVRAARELFF